MSRNRAITPIFSSCILSARSNFCCSSFLFSSLNSVRNSIISAADDLYTSFIIFPHGGFSKTIWYTILQLNTNILKLIILHSNLDNYKFKNSTINLRFNAFLKVEIVLLSFKVRSNEFQMVVVL